jgi:hypothetical protein
MSADKKPTCGRCGVYRHLHPTTRCTKPRLSFWWDRHSAADHVMAWLWIHALTSRLRWWICAQWSKRFGRDWCEVVDSAVRADNWSDWRGDYSGKWGCLCDFPLPHTAGAPRPGWCYCQPEAERAS